MAKIKLRAIKDGKDKNRYCGPSVISALTDLTTGEAARLIRKQNGRKTIRGSYTHEVLDALRACNIQARHWEKPGVGLNRKTGPTLAGWLKQSKDIRTPGRVFLISAGNHWQLVSGRRYTCGRIREIVSIKDKRVKRRARVDNVWELMSDNVTRPRDADRNEIDVSKPKPRYNKGRYEAQKMIQQHPEFGFDVEPDEYGLRGSYYVQMSPELEKLAFEKNEMQDGRCCDGWLDVTVTLSELIEWAEKNYSKLTS